MHPCLDMTRPIQTKVEAGRSAWATEAVLMISPVCQHSCMWLPGYHVDIESSSPLSPGALCSFSAVFGFPAGLPA